MLPWACRNTRPMKRPNATLLFVCLLVLQTCWAAGERLIDFLQPPPLGGVKTEIHPAGKVAVQKTPGRHKGHRILSVGLPLCAGEAPCSYELHYHACLEVAAHPRAIEVATKEGLSGLGLVRPSSANWYRGGFIDVRVNGHSVGLYKPNLSRVTYRSGAVAVKATWRMQGGTVALTFVQVPDEEFIRVLGEIADTEVNSLEVRLRCYPSIIRRTGTRVAWTASRRRDRLGTLAAGRRESWFLLADRQYDCAKTKRGDGPCAVMFAPSEVMEAKAKLSDYAVDVTLRLRAELRKFHLAIWEFKDWPNQKALDYLRGLSDRLVAQIGLVPTRPVCVTGVPPRAIVVDGQPAATIVLRAKPGDREIQAAEEIQRYVAKCADAVLPIAVGNDNARGHIIALDIREPKPNESSEAFRLRVSDRRTEISGNSPLAVLYGAYELLERGLGVRWYLPGPLGEVVPVRSTLVLPALDVKQSPSFPMRWIGRGEWALRNKQNQCDDGFLIYPGIYHTQGRILPHRKYYRMHPEFFASLKGQRSDTALCKLCYSNRDTVRQVASNMAAMLDANPNIKLISLSPTDGQMWCECSMCRAMDESNVPKDRRMSRRSLLFYNAVARELRKTHPNARMLVGAYNVYNWPPKDKSIKADPMIDVIITHYEDYCMAHPVADPTCPRNQRYVKLIKEWQALGCGIFFYEYYWKVNWFDLPWPIVHSIRRDIPWYKQQGHRGVFSQYNPDCIWGQYPAHYVAAKLLWNVDADVDAILDKMYTDMYGAAAPHMKAYHELMEKQMAECGAHFPGRGTSFGPAVFTKSVRAKLREYYQGACKANQDETVAKRLKKIGTSLEYVDRLMHYAALKRATTSEPDPIKAAALAQEALACGKQLVNEIRTDREKWGGVVSTTVVTRGYLARNVEGWQKVTMRKKALTIKAVASLPKTWRFALDKGDVGQKERWFAEGFDDSAWKRIQIGKTWESQGYDYDGFAWYRVKFSMRNAWLKRPLSIFFGGVDGEAWVYWNGKLLGHHVGWDEPFAFALDPKLIRTDKPNLIAVRVFDGASNGGIYRKAYFVEKK